MTQEYYLHNNGYDPFTSPRLINVFPEISDVDFSEYIDGSFWIVKIPSIEEFPDLIIEESSCFIRTNKITPVKKLYFSNPSTIEYLLSKDQDIHCSYVIYSLTFDKSDSGATFESIKCVLNEKFETIDSFIDYDLLAKIILTSRLDFLEEYLIPKGFDLSEKDYTNLAIKSCIELESTSDSDSNSASNSSLEVLKKLVKLGLNILNIKSYTMNNIVLHGKYDLCEYILSQGYDVAKFNNNALTTALNTYDRESILGAKIIDLLILYGASPCGENKSVYNACRRGSKKTVEFLLQLGGSMEDLASYKIMHAAVNDSNLDFVKYCLDMGATLHPSTLRKLTFNKGKYDLDVVKFLVGEGLKIDYKTMLNAINFHRLDVLEYFLEVCDVSVVNLEWGAINAFSLKALPPLKFFIKNGVSIKCLDSIINEDYVDSLITNRYNDILRYLCRRYRAEAMSCDMIFTRAIENNSLDLVSYLIKKGLVEVNDEFLKLAKEVGNNFIINIMENTN